jgi:hypothetical protein
MGISIYDHLPPTFTDFMIGQVAGQVAQKIEQNIWTGNTNVNGNFASFSELFLSGSQAGGQNAPVSGTWTAANNVTGSTTVLAGLQQIVNVIPITVYGKEDLGIYVSTQAMKAFQTAVGGGSTFANGYMNQTVIGQKPMDFQGIPLLHCPGLPAATVVAAQKSNLFFGTALLSDKNEVKVLDMADLDGSQNVRIIMRYTAGVQYGIGSDIVYYS